MMKVEKKIRSIVLINVKEANPDTITTYEEKKTISVLIQTGNCMVCIHDNRIESKQEGKMVLGPALMLVFKGIYSNFPARFLYLSDIPPEVKGEEIDLDLRLNDEKISFEKENQDILKHIIF